MTLGTIVAPTQITIKFFSKIPNKIKIVAITTSYNNNELH